MLRHISTFIQLAALAAPALAQPPPVSVRSSPAAEGGIRGRVIDAATRAPIAGATVYGDDAADAVITDEDGGFTLPAGARSLTIVSDDHEAQVVDRGLAGALVVELVPAGGDDGGEVIEISGGRLATAPGAVTLERQQLTVLPGARGDVLSGIKNLPGVANNGSLTPLSSGLIIRGSSPEDSRILVDGFEIPVLYHFLGVQSVLPTEMIGDLEYLPGSFGTSWGRASGGIVSVTSRGEATEHAGFAELSFLNAAGLVQGPLGTKGSYAFAGRRSVIDAILPGVIPDDADLAFTAYPRYYDYQGKLTYRPRPRWTLAAFAFGSDDDVTLENGGDNAADPVAAGRFSNATSFTRLITSAKYKRAGLQTTVAASGYTDTNHFTVGADRFLRLDRDGLAARTETLWDPTAKLRVIAGGEVDVTRTRFDIKFTRPPREGDPRGPNFTQDALLEQKGDNTSRDLAVWSSIVAYPVPALELTGGARVDSYLRNEVTVVQPRGQLVWRPADGTTLRAAGGLYTRPPQHLDEGLQTDVGPERAVQTSAGVEQRLSPALTVRATAFHHRMSDLLVLPADRRDMASLGGYENLGSGAASGLELMLQLRTERAFGWLAYTGARATRRDAEGMPERRFDYDQAHNLIAVASWELSPRWRIGGRFQLTTGKPFTPVTGATYQADVDLYLPQYGTPASQRVDTQHQLDLRVDRVWAFDRWKLSAYLDISNVYLNAAEIEYQYNFDYTRRTAITTLPILPSFGVRGEL